MIRAEIINESNMVNIGTLIMHYTPAKNEYLCLEKDASVTHYQVISIYHIASIKYQYHKAIIYVKELLLPPPYVSAEEKQWSEEI